MTKIPFQKDQRNYRPYRTKFEVLFWLLFCSFVFGTNTTSTRTVVSSSSANQTKSIAASNQTGEVAKEISIHHVPLTVNWVPLIAAYNSHHANIYIGSPPQKRLVIVDTGSRTLVVPCKPCQHCGNKHFSKDYLDLKYSSTDYSNQCRLHECTFVMGGDKTCTENNECNFKLSYSEGSSIQGFELEDIVWLGTDNFEQSVKVHMQTAVPLSFGCESHETGIIAEQFADGIMGLVSEARKQDNIVDVMYRSGVIPHHAFSMCLTKDGGVLSLGGTALAKRHLESMQMMPLTSSNYYTVSVEALYVGDEQIGGDFPSLIPSAFNDGKGTVIDSGTVRVRCLLMLERYYYCIQFELTKLTCFVHPSI